LIGIPLGITAHRKETSIGFLLSLIVAVTYFLIIFVGYARREDPHWHPVELMWLPNVLCLTLGSWLFLRMARR